MSSHVECNTLLITIKLYSVQGSLYFHILIIHKKKNPCKIKLTVQWTFWFGRARWRQSVAKWYWTSNKSKPPEFYFISVQVMRRTDSSYAPVKIIITADRYAISTCPLSSYITDMLNSVWFLLQGGQSSPCDVLWLL